MSKELALLLSYLCYRMFYVTTQGQLILFSFNDPWGGKKTAIRGGLAHWAGLYFVIGIT